MLAVAKPQRGLISPQVFPGLPATPTEITNEMIIRVVCRELEVAAEDLTTKSRKSELVRARYVIWNLMSEYNYTPTIKAGLIFKKDHTSVIHGLKTLRFEIETYPSVRQLYDRIALAVLREAEIEARPFMKAEKTNIKSKEDEKE